MTPHQKLTKMAGFDEAAAYAFDKVLPVGMNLLALTGIPGLLRALATKGGARLLAKPAGRILASLVGSSALSSGAQYMHDKGKPGDSFRHFVHSADRGRVRNAAQDVMGRAAMLARSELPSSSFDFLKKTNNQNRSAP